ncbi:hypothetical protein [Lichenihabitans psoromatis]|uniref:hypothetical protein n=2 Tax=Lichenihabitans psoromatis TaxID=2528642 RepID=UPI0010385DC0|nr:hypothetical protein [Lichenihabitans psoromatis]
MTIDRFRQDLGKALRGSAAHKRKTIGQGLSTDQDIDCIILLERLADDADTSPEHLFDRYGRTFADTQSATMYFGRQKALLDRVGVDCVPHDVGELLGWLGRRTKEQHAKAETASPMVSPRLRSAVRDSATIFALDLSAGVGIIAPMVAIWEIKQGIGQWMDRSVALNHPSVQATVLAIERPGAERHFSGSTITLSYKMQDGTGLCQTAVHTLSPASFPPAGETIEVVPRSSTCGSPIIPSQIGDPAATFGLVLVLIAASLASLKVWLRLLHRPTRGSIRPVWTRSVVSDRSRV